MWKLNIPYFDTIQCLYHIKNDFEMSTFSMNKHLCVLKSGDVIITYNSYT